MIPVTQAREAAKLATLAANLLLATSNEQKGDKGSALRRACGDMKAYAEVYIAKNVIAEKLSYCFAQARVTGATLSEFNYIRKRILAEPIVSLVAMLIKNGCISCCLQQMSMVLVGTTFTSREDVEKIRGDFNIAFDEAEETAADEMALAVYRSLIALHAAVVFHMYETARPLPQMLAYRFATPRPTLVLSHRLYDSASRADELREENKIVHPAFAPREGRALAF